MLIPFAIRHHDATRFVYFCAPPYVNSVSFNNTTNNQGNTTRVATLIVNPKDYKLTVRASPPADGAVSGGGEVAEGSSTTVTAMPDSGHSFVHWTESGKVVSTSPSYTFTMPSATVTLVADLQRRGQALAVQDDGCQPAQVGRYAAGLRAKR